MVSGFMASLRESLHYKTADIVAVVDLAVHDRLGRT